ncbi:putative Rpc11-DNA-directed RNA polymerase III subunit C11 [Neoconidiobolus thromboides FSU 785]|nr:putative Rpc11-DNA-directed RNA polymerase III subunit C11 [Neoconidiobolus thromboides FSU 785]
MLFCPLCGNMLIISQSETQTFSCQTCPYQFLIQKTHVSRYVLKRKEVDDVLGGAESWENVDQTDAACPKCENGRAFYFQLQIRSADEPMTTFYKCTSSDCSHKWKEN